MRWGFVQTVLSGRQIVELDLAGRGTTMKDPEARELGTERNPVDVLRPDNEIRHRPLSGFKTLQMGGVDGATRPSGVADPAHAAGRLGTDIVLADSTITGVSGSARASAIHVP